MYLNARGWSVRRKHVAYILMSLIELAVADGNTCVSL